MIISLKIMHVFVDILKLDKFIKHLDALFSSVFKFLGARFINLEVSALTDKWYGESQKLAAAVFSLVCCTHIYRSIIIFHSCI